MMKISKLFYILFAVVMLWGCSGGSSDSSAGVNSGTGEGGSVAKNVTVTFNGNGAESGSMSVYNAEYGVPFKLPKNTYEKTGYTFAGWVETGSQIKYADESEVILYEDIVLQAEWNKIDESGNYTITLKANNGSNEEKVYNVSAGEKFSLPYELFNKEGSVLAGWSKTQNGSVDYYDREVFSVDGGLELYAVWQSYNPEAAVTINFEGNGGTGYDYPKDAIGGEVFLDWTSFKKDGATFLGWSERSDSKYPSFKDGLSFPAKRSMTLYAVWGDVNDSNIITFKFNKSNSSVCFIPDEISVYFGDNITIPELGTCKNNELVGVGYTDSNGNKYFEGAEVKAEHDLSIDVVWSNGSRPDFAGLTKWVYNVNVKPEDWVTGDKIAWKEGANWYDIYQRNFELCWAASASNVILWWYNTNKQYVDKYFSEKGYNGPSLEYNSAGSSPIYDNFTKVFPNSGGIPTVAFNYFVFGNSSLNGGGFFKDVFGDNLLTYKTGKKDYIDKVMFNYLLSDAFENKKAVSLYVTIGGPHIITLWGADYNADGYISHVYISNSNSNNKDYNGLKGDLEHCEIQYNYLNAAQMLCSDYEPTEVFEIYTYSLGEEYWKEYFKNK